VLGNQSHRAIFFTHAAAMVSPRSLELKQGAKKPSMEEAKRCELKLPVEIKRTAGIRCGGRVPTGAIASRNPVKKENVPRAAAATFSPSPSSPSPPPRHDPLYTPSLRCVPHHSWCNAHHTLTVRSRGGGTQLRWRRRRRRLEEGSNNDDN
jgi:hypothetical protein